jgi:type VI secretion system protein ImpK
MREEIANLVHPVFTRGLRLKERLHRGEALSFEAEQAALVGLLLADQEARRWPTFGGADDDTGPGAADTTRHHGPFLGARYALVCWLDEIFILDSPWSERWNEHKLEVRLYGSNDRAWKFWDQAQLAAARTDLDALEIWFSCVMLGFTGELIEDPARLAAWISATRQQWLRARAGEWRAPPGIEPPTRVPPLTGRDRLRRMLLVASAALLAVIPAVAIVLALRMG